MRVARGAKLTLLARDLAKLRAVREELAGSSAAERVTIAACDVARAEQVDATFAPLCRHDSRAMVVRASVDRSLRRASKRR